MLPAPHRMRRSDMFRAAVRSGVRSGRRHLVVHLLVPSSEAGAASVPQPTLVGLVVSRAVGPAVVRTTVKRRLRHLMAARLDAVPPGSAVVVRATPQAAGCARAVLAAELDGALAGAVRAAARAGRRHAGDAVTGAPV